MPKADLTIFAKASKNEIIRQFKGDSDAKIVVWSGLDDIDNPYTPARLEFIIHTANATAGGDPTAPIDKTLPVAAGVDPVIDWSLARS